MAVAPIHYGLGRMAYGIVRACSDMVHHEPT